MSSTQVAISAGRISWLDGAETHLFSGPYPDLGPADASPVDQLFEHAAVCACCAGPHVDALGDIDFRAPPGWEWPGDGPGLAVAANPVEAVQGTIPLLGQNQQSIKVYFADAGVLSRYGQRSDVTDPDWTGEEDWTAAEKAIVLAALDEIETLINVQFVVTTSQSQAELEFFKNDDSGSLGTAGTQWSSYAISSIRMNHTISDRWLLGKEKGGQGYETLVHEIGHALGLGHTHDGGFGSDTLQGIVGQSPFSGGTDGLNDPINSIMAYRDGWAAEGTSNRSYGNRGNFGTWDMAALINRYGENTATNTGNDTYTLPEASATGTFFQTIHDNGGIDTISAGSTTLNATIDLRAASLDYNTTTSGGPVSHLWLSSFTVARGGFTIESGSVIENAEGGAGNDRITGNSVDNALLGGDGNDTLTGGDGNDTLTGGAGADTLDGGNGDDRFVFVAALAGQDEVVLDYVFGNNGTDRIAVDSTFDAVFDFRAAAGLSFIDEIEFDASSGEAARTIKLLASQIGSNLVSSSLFVDGNGLENSDDIIEVHMDGAASLNLSNWEFRDWQDVVDPGVFITLPYPRDDKVRVIGASTAELLIGTKLGDELIGNDGADTLNGLSGADTLDGGADGDELNGGDKDDVLFGGDGNDTLDGDEGNDLLDGGAGDDFLDGGAPFDGVDTVFGGAGNDTLVVYGSSGTYDGGEGDDVADIFSLTISGLTLTGGAGIDTLDFSSSTFSFNVNIDLVNGFFTGTTGIWDPLWSGFENVEGVQGPDVIGGNELANTLSGNDGDDTIDGRAGDDSLEGDAGDDSLFGGDGNDTVFGGDGEDTLEGGAGADSVWGGNDRDTVYSADGSPGDTLDGGAGDDLLVSAALAAGQFYLGGPGSDTVDLSADTAYSGLVFDLLANVFTVMGATFASIENFTDNDFANQVNGTDAANRLYGEGGDDTLYGNKGNDSLDGWTGNDFIDAGAGADSVLGFDGDDTLLGAQGDDTLRGEAGNDLINGGNNVDLLYGDAGRDKVFGGNGSDEAFGGADNDTLIGGRDASGDLLHGGDGDDIILGQEGEDTLYGEAGDDRLSGGTLSDELYGGDGADTLLGAGGQDLMDGGDGDDELIAGGGFDTLIGGAGNDTLTGQTQSDVFAFADGFGNDIITDFDTSDPNEIINLTDVTNIESYGDLVLNHMIQFGSDVLIIDGADTITLANASLASFTADNFEFAAPARIAAGAGHPEEAFDAAASARSAAHGEVEAPAEAPGPQQPALIAAWEAVAGEQDDAWL